MLKLNGGNIITKRIQNEDLVNESIRFREVLVIGSDGEQLGVMPTSKAISLAYDEELDLLCVAPNANPAVCKIIDYGKHRFESQKKAKEAKKNQHTTELKPIRLSPVIDKHDFETKVKHSRKWLEGGMKVKADMRFRGRLITRLEVGKKVMNSFILELEDIAVVEKRPMLEGNTMSVVLAPRKDK